MSDPKQPSEDQLAQAEDHVLEGLAQRFMEAVEHKTEGRIDDAEDTLRDILKVEPRLAEPQLELARLLLDTSRHAAAEHHAREAVRILENGGQWTDEIPEGVLRGLAHATLAETLRRIAEEDDVIFGAPERFHELVNEAKLHFGKAAEFDPSDEYASYHAFFMGVPGAEMKLPGESTDEPQGDQ